MTLSYRSFLKTAYRIIFWALVAIFLALIRIHIFDLMELSWPVLILRFISLSSFVLVLIFRLFFQIRPNIFAHYKLDKESLKVIHKKTEKIIRFQDVKVVKLYTFSNLFGGFSVKLFSGKRLFFPFALKGSEHILSALRDVKPELIGERKFQNYIKRGHNAEHSWQRASQRGRQWHSTILKYFLWGPLLAFYIQYLHPKTNLLWTALWLSFCLWVYATVLHLLEEWILLKIAPQKRCLKAEALTFWTSTVVFYSVSFALVVFIF